jgi:putative ABC transport system substrate-binding protein
MPNLQAFFGGLADQGFVEGRNVAVDWRWTEGHQDRLPALAASLVNRPVAVILANGGNGPTLAAKNATSTIPIVFFDNSDPVRDGLIASLKGPNGNITGIALLETELTLKRVELLNELISGNAPLAILIDPTMELIDIESMTTVLAERFKRPVNVVHAVSPDDFGSAFDAIGQQHAAGVVIPSGPFAGQHHQELAALAAQHSLPAIYGNNVDLAASGGLMSYGAPLPEMLRLAGNYVGKILKGARPEDMPVQQPTKITLKINLKTAKSLGLTVPTSILVRADEVIE